MGDLVVAFPFYRHISVNWFLNWLNMEKDAMAGTVAVEGMYLPVAMQKLVDMAFEHFPDFRRLVVFEQDMIPPANALTRIANYPDDADIVSSIYFKHDHPYHVMAWMQVDKPRFSPLTAGIVKTMVDNPALYDVDGVAMGFTSIHRRVFENWDPGTSLWNPSPPFVGHDLHFCHEAKRQGFGIFVDSGIGCGHLTLMPIGYPHSQAALAEQEPQTWEEALANGQVPEEVPAQ